MDLPLELWYNILRIATDLPGALDTAYYDPVSSPWTLNHYWTVDNFARSHKSTFYVKCNVVRVCRAWNRLATIFLYEAIVIPDQHRLVLLARTLVEGDLGRYIIRLEIPRISSPDAVEVAPCLKTVFLCAPNLSILSLEDPAWMRDTTAPEADTAKLWFPSLKYLRWNNQVLTNAHPSEDIWASRMAPKLEVLCLRNMAFLSTWHESHALPNLHTFIAEMVCETLDVIANAPALRQFGCDNLTIGLSPQCKFPARAVTLITHRASALLPPTIGGNLTSGCEEMLIHTDPWGAYFVGTHAIQRIAIVLDRVITLKDQFQALSRDAASFPSLELIRIHINPKTWASWEVVLAHRRVWVFFVHWTKFWEAKRVRVEDEEGNLLAARLAEVPEPPMQDGEYAKCWAPPREFSLPQMGFLGLL